MILGGETIKTQVELGKIKIDPYSALNVGPNSYDIRLGTRFLKVVDNHPEGYIDPGRPQCTDEWLIELGEGLVIQPGELWLGHTIEIIGSRYYVPMIEGRSSIGRMGLFIHVTAGFGDLGFLGQWTLELVATQPVNVYPGMKIGQVFFHTVTENTIQYTGRYNGQVGPTESRYNQ